MCEGVNFVRNNDLFILVTSADAMDFVDEYSSCVSCVDLVISDVELVISYVRLVISGGDSIHTSCLHVYTCICDVRYSLLGYLYMSLPHISQRDMHHLLS